MIPGSNIDFHIDSKYSSSLLPSTYIEPGSKPDGSKLYAPDGTPINCYSVRTVDVVYYGVTCPWTFIVADVPRAVLGADFLDSHSYLQSKRGTPTSATASKGIETPTPTKQQPSMDKTTRTPPKQHEEKKWTIAVGLDPAKLRELQLANPPMPIKNSKTSITDVPLEDGTLIACDTSTGTPRPWIPEELRREAFDLIHNLSHPSMRATSKLLRQRYIWPGISKDAKRWSKTCLPCQSSKVHRHTETGISSYDEPARRFGHIHVDIVGPLPISDGYKYMFTAIDRTTRWPEAFPIKDATADSCVNALTAWVSRFGLPDTITSDRGTNFTSNLWSAVTRNLGIQHRTTTSYNPEANGLVERFHRSLKASLMSRCTDSTWTQQLPWVLLGLRTVPKTADDVSPSERVFCEVTSVPGDFFKKPPMTTQDEIRNTVRKFLPQPQTYKQRNTYVPPDLKDATHVFVRHDAAKPPLTRPYKGPYQVLMRRPKALLLQLDLRKDWVSIDRCKPAYLIDETTPVRFSRAGRPISMGLPFSGGSTVPTANTTIDPKDISIRTRD